jgi:hypothetical protein
MEKDIELLLSIVCKNIKSQLGSNFFMKEEKYKLFKAFMGTLKPIDISQELKDKN